uniref:Sushi domain-containing protein n=1 Tax=Terrapene triunguis TaxID=2587831 RepID=A0A674JUM6_9SAUR
MPTQHSCQGVGEVPVPHPCSLAGALSGQSWASPCTLTLLPGRSIYLDGGNCRFRPQRNVYRNGDVLIITCNHGFHINNDQDTAECTKNGWLPSPGCSMTVFSCVFSDMRCAAGKCGPPPGIDNGDTIAFAQPVYESGLSVEYRCKSLHVMRGSPFVHCESGQWTNPPVCLEPCSASSEEMEKNNIDLKWRETTKLYSESGDFIEFDCKWGYERDPLSSEFRVQCVEGKIAYPKCKKRGK